MRGETLGTNIYRRLLRSKAEVPKRHEPKPLKFKRMSTKATPGRPVANQNGPTRGCCAMVRWQSVKRPELLPRLSISIQQHRAALAGVRLVVRKPRYKHQMPIKDLSRLTHLGDADHMNCPYRKRARTRRLALMARPCGILDTWPFRFFCGSERSPGTRAECLLQMHCFSFQKTI